MYSQVFSSYYQQVNAATVQFRKFGIVPVSSLFSGGFGVLSEDREFFLPNPPKLSCGFKQISMSMCLHIVLYNVKIYMCLCNCIIDVKCEQNKFPFGQ